MGQVKLRRCMVPTSNGPACHLFEVDPPLALGEVVVELEPVSARTTTKPIDEAALADLLRSTR